jgi:hypothetical protein
MGEAVLVAFLPACRSNGHLWLWVPAFAGTTSGLNAKFSRHSSGRIQNLPASSATHEQGDVMERRHFLKIAFAAAAGTAVLAAGAKAAPLAPQPLAQDQRPPAANEELRPAVTSADEVDRLKPAPPALGLAPLASPSLAPPLASSSVVRPVRQHAAAMFCVSA